MKRAVLYANIDGTGFGHIMYVSDIGHERGHNQIIVGPYGERSELPKMRLKNGQETYVKTTKYIAVIVQTDFDKLRHITDDFNTDE